MRSLHECRILATVMTLLSLLVGSLLVFTGILAPILYLLVSSLVGGLFIFAEGILHWLTPPPEGGRPTKVKVKRRRHWRFWRKEPVILRVYGTKAYYDAFEHNRHVEAALIAKFFGKAASGLLVGFLMVWPVLTSTIMPIDVRLAVLIWLAVPIGMGGSYGASSYLDGRKYEGTTGVDARTIDEREGYFKGFFTMLRPDPIERRMPLNFLEELEAGAKWRLPKAIQMMPAGKLKFERIQDYESRVEMAYDDFRDSGNGNGSPITLPQDMLDKMRSNATLTVLETRKLVRWLKRNGNGAANGIAEEPVHFFEWPTVDWRFKFYFLMRSAKLPERKCYRKNLPLAVGFKKVKFYDLQFEVLGVHIDSWYDKATKTVMTQEMPVWGCTDLPTGAKQVSWNDADKAMFDLAVDQPTQMEYVRELAETRTALNRAEERLVEKDEDTFIRVWSRMKTELNLAGRFPGNFVTQTPQPAHPALTQPFPWKWVLLGLGIVATIALGSAGIIGLLTMLRGG